MSGLYATIVSTIGPDACLLTDDIAKAVKRPRNKVATAVGRLILRGYVERIERGCYRLTPAGKATIGRPIKSGPRGPLTGTRAPADNSFRQRAWNAMRIVRTFTTADILERAQKAEERDMADNLGHYLRDLVAVEVVVETPRRSKAGEAPTSNGRKVYRLSRDLGPIAPRVGRDGRLVDFNREAAQ